MDEIEDGLELPAANSRFYELVKKTPYKKGVGFDVTNLTDDEKSEFKELKESSGFLNDDDVFVSLQPLPTATVKAYNTKTTKDNLLAAAKTLDQKFIEPLKDITGITTVKNIINNPSDYMRAAGEVISDIVTLDPAPNPNNWMKMLDVAEVTPAGKTFAAAGFMSPFFKKGIKKNIIKDKNFEKEIDWKNWVKYKEDFDNNPQVIKHLNDIEQTTKANGTWMKNPDGSPFKGTKEQFVVQQSDNFKKYYNNSLVKTEKGNPLFMYHGSNSKNITEFKLPGSKGYKKSPTTTTGDSGIYFTDLKEYADKYQNFAMIKGLPKGKTYQVYTAPKTAVKAGDTPMDGIVKGLPPAFLWNHGKISADAVLTGNYMKKVYPKHGFEVSMENPNLIKSAVGNILFDITNPNIYKALTGAAATGAIASQQQYKNGGLVSDPPDKKKLKNRILKEYPGFKSNLDKTDFYATNILDSNKTEFGDTETMAPNQDTVRYSRDNSNYKDLPNINYGTGRYAVYTNPLNVDISKSTIPLASELFHTLGDTKENTTNPVLYSLRQDIIDRGNTYDAFKKISKEYMEKDGGNDINIYNRINADGIMRNILYNDVLNRTGDESILYENKYYPPETKELTYLFQPMSNQIINYLQNPQGYPLPQINVTAKRK